MNTSNEVHSNIAIAIMKSGMSQSEIAKQTGVSQTSVRRWINNMGGISLEHFLSVSKVIGINPLSILRNEDLQGSKLFEISELEKKVISKTLNLPKEKYYKLEEVIRLLEED